MWREDLKWWNKNCSELQEKYPSKWIAILKQKVVVVGDDSSDLIEEVRKKYGETPFVTFCRPKGYIRIRRRLTRLSK